MTENGFITLLSTGIEMFLTEQTVLTIKVYFLQNVSTAVILSKVKCFFRKRKKFLAAAAKINTYYGLSGAI